MKRLVYKTKNKIRQIRHARVRKAVIGTKEVPRLSVFRGNKSVIAQLIDDATGKTLCYATSAKQKGPAKVEGKTGKVAKGYLVGQALAEAAKAKGITKAVFDRGGYKFHGRIAAVAEGARAGGLKF